MEEVLEQKSELVIPVLLTLSWLHNLLSKVSVLEMVFKALHNVASHYLSDLISYSLTLLF